MPTSTCMKESSPSPAMVADFQSLINALQFASASPSSIAGAGASGDVGRPPHHVHTRSRECIALAAQGLRRALIGHQPSPHCVPSSSSSLSSQSSAFGTPFDLSSPYRLLDFFGSLAACTAIREAVAAFGSEGGGQANAADGDDDVDQLFTVALPALAAALAQRVLSTLQHSPSSPLRGKMGLLSNISGAFVGGGEGEGTSGGGGAAAVSVVAPLSLGAANAIAAGSPMVVASSTFVSPPLPSSSSANAPLPPPPPAGGLKGPPPPLMPPPPVQGGGGPPPPPARVPPPPKAPSAASAPSMPAPPPPPPSAPRQLPLPPPPPAAKAGAGAGLRTPAAAVVGSALSPSPIIPSLDLAATDAHGCTALHYAAQCCRPNVVAGLLQLIVVPSTSTSPLPAAAAPTNGTNATATVTAVVSPLPAATSVTIAALTAAADADGRVPLHHALLCGERGRDAGELLEVVCHLVGGRWSLGPSSQSQAEKKGEEGSSRTINNEGHTSEGGDEIGEGVDFLNTARDAYGCTILHYAARHCQHTTLRILTNHEGCWSALPTGRFRGVSLTSNAATATNNNDGRKDNDGQSTCVGAGRKVMGGGGARLFQTKRTVLGRDGEEEEVVISVAEESESTVAGGDADDDGGEEAKKKDLPPPPPPPRHPFARFAANPFIRDVYGRLPLHHLFLNATRCGGGGLRTADSGSSVSAVARNPTMNFSSSSDSLSSCPVEEAMLMGGAEQRDLGKMVAGPIAPSASSASAPSSSSASPPVSVSSSYPPTFNSLLWKMINILTATTTAAPLGVGGAADGGDGNNIGGDVFGCTPLHYAACHCDLTTYALLTCEFPQKQTEEEGEEERRRQRCRRSFFDWSVVNTIDGHRPIHYLLRRYSSPSSCCDASASASASPTTNADEDNNASGADSKRVRSALLGWIARREEGAVGAPVDLHQALPCDGAAAAQYFAPMTASY